MSTKFLIFVLGTFLLVQCTHGYAVGKKIDDSSSEETNKVHIKMPTEEQAIEAGLGVVFTAVAETKKLVDSSYNAMRTVFQPLIANLDTTGHDAKCELTEKLEKVKELFEKTDKLAKNDKAEFIVEMANIFGGDLDNTEDAAADATELEKNFVKAKKALEVEGVKILTTFSDRIIAAADAYWNSLSAEDKVEEKDFYDHLMTIKSEPDLEKRVDLLKAAFHADDDSNEEKH